ncbi:MAG: hypothetical protein DME25_12540, partial [Verrucomicrobia bacterium]
MKRPAPRAPEIRTAYDRYTLVSGIRNATVALILVIVLMPIGYVLDYFVYPNKAEYFFLLRLCTSAIAGLVLVGLRQPGWSDRQYRLLCAGWWLVPSVFISLMIADTEGLASTYYAGLNLVMLAVSSVIQATMLESIVAISVITTLYLLACLRGASPFDLRLFVNNGYFMFCTAAIVLTGNFYFNRLRLREFSLRWELDENRRQLEDSNRKLTELDHLKSRFFANVSHELRTPLTLLLAPLETIIRRHGRAFDEPTRHLLHTMQSNGMRLLRLINDLLDLFRLDSGVMQVRREAIDIAELLRGLASAARQLADDKRLRLETHVSPEVGTVMADRDKLEKILLNLQLNALKFSPAGGRVELRARREGEELVLQVTDTGV